MSGDGKVVDVSGRLGELLLKGWTMLAETCPVCVDAGVPLMRERRTMKMLCVKCGTHFQPQRAQQQQPATPQPENNYSSTTSPSEAPTNNETPKSASSTSLVELPHVLESPPLSPIQTQQQQQDIRETPVVPETTRTKGVPLSLPTRPPPLSSPKRQEQNEDIGNLHRVLSKDLHQASEILSCTPFPSPGIENASEVLEYRTKVCEFITACSNALSAIAKLP
ncbi:hypothetical protein Pelo_16803 [Pelomyxa schiedti]|nr:hypothetical protein Pelo_16803 [Pelomyxa schiedti]